MRMLFRRRWSTAVAAAVTIGALAACSGKSGKTEYSQSPDSGAVPPAMRIDTSLSRTYPDSTTGGPNRTGKPGVAGDTLSTRGRPAGTGVRPVDTARKRP